MRIRLRKLSEERHELAISRDGASWETAECETRSYLTHDLLHYAVEAEAGVQSGFWGRLASGATLAEMNDRARAMEEVAFPRFRGHPDWREYVRRSDPWRSGSDVRLQISSRRMR
jgi:hypothetical protein